MKRANPKSEEKEEYEADKIDLSQAKIITYHDDPQKLNDLKLIIENLHKTNEVINEHIQIQSAKVEQVCNSIEKANDNIDHGNAILKETSKKYGFFRTLKMKVAAFFGIAGAATGNPISGLVLGAGAYGLGSMAEAKNNKQLNKLDK